MIFRLTADPRIEKLGLSKQQCEKAALKRSLNFGKQVKVNDDAMAWHNCLYFFYFQRRFSGIVLTEMSDLELEITWK